MEIRNLPIFSKISLDINFFDVLSSLSIPRDEILELEVLIADVEE
jgi:hypothetical protein